MIIKPPATDAGATIASLRSLGTGSTQACAGNDSRLGTSSSVALVTAALPANLNLSTQGTIDWFHIHSITGNPPYLTATHRKISGESDMFHSFVWFGPSGAGLTISNADLDFPCTTTAGDDAAITGVISAYENGSFIAPSGTQTGHGFRFRVRATRSQRVLRVYLGRNATSLTCTATHTDGTTTNLSVAQAGGSPTVFQLGQMVTCTYNSAFEGQELYFEAKATTTHSNGGTVNFMGATLASS